MLKHIFSNNRIKNFIIMFFTTFFGKFLSICTISIIARNILVSDKGLYDYYNVIINYVLLLINFGFELYFMEINSNGRFDSEYLFTVQVKARGLCSGVIFTSTLLIMIFNNKLFSKSILLLLLMIKLFSYTFDLSWKLRLDEKFNKLSKYEIINAILRLFLVLFLLKGNNILALVIIDIMLDFLYKVNIYRNYRYKIIKKVKIIEIVNIVKKSFIINLSTFMISIYYNVDSLMLGFFKSSYEVAIYTGAYTFLTLAIIPTNILYQIYSPYLIKNKNNNLGLKKYIITTGVLGIVVFLGSFIFGPTLIRIVMGNQYIESAKLFKLLSIDLIPCYFAGAFANPINAWGNYKVYFKIVMAGGIFNIIGNLILIPIYSISGAIITTIGSECIVVVLSILWWLKKRKSNHIETERGK